jgi:DNA modification methylase
VRLDRRFLGIELKASYYNLAVRNLRAAEHAKAQGSLFAAGA